MVASLQAIKIGRHNNNGIHESANCFVTITDIGALELFTNGDHFFDYEGGALQNQSFKSIFQLGEVIGCVDNPVANLFAVGDMFNLGTDLIQVLVQIRTHPGQYRTGI